MTDTGCPKCNEIQKETGVNTNMCYTNMCYRCRLDYLDSRLTALMREMEEIKKQIERGKDEL